MANPKQSGQPSGGMFQKYTGEQINQIPEGYVQAMGSMGQAYQSIGQSLGNAFVQIGQAKANEAKLQGQIAPYAEKTRQNIEQSVKSGNLIKNPDGTVAPNTAAGITPAMVDSNAIDFYNKSGGGDITKLSSSDLTKYSAAFQSAQDMAKIEIDRSKTALDTELTKAKIEDLNSKTEERKQGAQAVGVIMANMGKSLSAGSASAFNAGLNSGATPTVEGSTPVQTAPEVKDGGAFSRYVNQETGTFGQPTGRPSYLGFEEKPKAQSTTKPGEVPSYAGFKNYVSSDQTNAPIETTGSNQGQVVNAPEADKKEMDRLISNIADYNKQANEAKDPRVKEMALGYSRAEQERFVQLQSKYLPAKAENKASQTQSANAGYGVRIDGTQKGAGWQGEIKTSDGGVMTEKSVGIQIGGKEVLVPAITPNTTKDQLSYLSNVQTNLIADAQKGVPIAKQIINDAVAHATPLVQQGKSPFAPVPSSQSVINQSIAQPTSQAPVQSQSIIPAPVAPQTPLQRVQSLNEQRTRMIQERDAAVTEAINTSQSMSLLAASVAKSPSYAGFGKLSFDYYQSLPENISKQYETKIKGIDEQIKGVQAEQAIIQAERSNKSDVVKAEEDKLAAIEKDVAGHPNVGVLTYRFKNISRQERAEMGISNLAISDVNEMRSQYEGFVKAQGFLNTLDDTLKGRERSGEDLLARTRLTTSSLSNWATAELADIFGVATFRKAIVSGGNFSDSDRIFVQKAIAYLNSLNPLDNAEVYRAKVNAVATFVNAMYMDGFKSRGYDFDPKSIEQRISLLRSKGLNDVADQEQNDLDAMNKFNQRFGFKSNSANKSNSAEVLAARKALEADVFDSTPFSAVSRIPSTYEIKESDGSIRTVNLERSRSKYFTK